jgi:hypothetical protein
LGILGFGILGAVVGLVLSWPVTAVVMARHDNENAPPGIAAAPFYFGVLGILAGFAIGALIGFLIPPPRDNR